jgi:hypothetical protein
MRIPLLRRSSYGVLKEPATQTAGLSRKKVDFWCLPIINEKGKIQFYFQQGCK